MRRYRKALFGLTAFTVVCVVMTWMVFSTLHRGIAGPTNSYSAIFTDVSGMKSGDDVRVAGVRVGRVDEIDLIDSTLAKVTFRVQRKQVLYTNTRASVTYQNVIGQRYLGLSPGAGGPTARLPNHGQIPKERTNPSFDITHLLNGFEPLFTQLDPQQVDNITNAIVRSFQGDSGSILALTTQASALAETLAGPDQVLGDLIGSLNELMGSLSAQSTNAANMIRQSREVMAELAGRRQALVESVGSINATVGRLAAIIDTIAPNMQEFIGRQPGFLEHALHDGRPRLGYMAANLPLLFKGLGRSFQDGASVSIYVCDLDFALWRGLFYWFRAFVAAATPGNGNEHWYTPVCR